MAADARKERRKASGIKFARDVNGAAAQENPKKHWTDEKEREYVSQLKDFYKPQEESDSPPEEGNGVWIDNKLLNLVKKRTNIVKKVIKLKKYKKKIVDHKRIRQVLKNIKSKSIKMNIDPKITQKIWSSMIKSYIDYERRNFKKIHKK